MDAQKKSLIASERDEGARGAWRAAEADTPAEAYVFVDECGCRTNMTPRYARAPKGERAYGRAPRNHHRNTTLVAALTVGGMGAAMTIEGAIDGEAFVGYLRQFLVPSLLPGQVVVLDNLNVHKNARVRPLVEGAGCRLVYLPSYSPDLNPIEHAFSKIKNHVRRAEPRDHNAVVSTLGAAMARVTARDAAGWVRHCGYPLPRYPP